MCARGVSFDPDTARPARKAQSPASRAILELSCATILRVAQVWIPVFLCIYAVQYAQAEATACAMSHKVSRVLHQISELEADQLSSPFSLQCLDLGIRLTQPQLFQRL